MIYTIGSFPTFPVESLANFVVAATNATPTVTAPSELSPSDYDVCATRVDPIPASTTMTFRCESTGVFGRYLFVLRQDQTSEQLVICEVEVYGEKRFGRRGVTCCVSSAKYTYASSISPLVLSCVLTSSQRAFIFCFTFFL